MLAVSRQRSWGVTAKMVWSGEAQQNLDCAFPANVYIWRTSKQMSCFVSIKCMPLTVGEQIQLMR